MILSAMIGSSVLGYQMNEMIDGVVNFPLGRWTALLTISAICQP